MNRICLLALVSLLVSGSTGFSMTHSSDSIARRNVLGGLLATCSDAPKTGFLRDGCCRFVEGDPGEHTVCAQVTQDFLEYTREQGNDLTRPGPGFAGLKPGDRWCLCASRWEQARKAGKAPNVMLRATDQQALERVSLAHLKAHAIDEP